MTGELCGNWAGRCRVACGDPACNEPVAADAGDFFPCAKCGKITHIDELDAKPEPRVNEYPGQWIVRAIYLGWMRWVRQHPGCSAWDDPDGNTNWERLECGECYGPGYVSSRDERSPANAQTVV